MKIKFSIVGLLGHAQVKWNITYIKRLITITLRAPDFNHVVVDEEEARVHYHTSKIESE